MDRRTDRWMDRQTELSLHRPPNLLPGDENWNLIGPLGIILGWAAWSNSSHKTYNVMPSTSQPSYGLMSPWMDPTLTHCPWGMWPWFQMCKFQTQLRDWYPEYSSKYYFVMNATGFHWWQVSIGTCNDLLPSGNKPFPEPMLILIYVAI